MTIRTLIACASIIGFCGFVALPREALATTMIEFDTGDLTIQADLILQGTVTSTWTEFGENGRYIYTFGMVDVDRVIKGNVQSDAFIIKRPGGSIGEVTMEVPAAADFETGDEVILFLLDDSSYESNILGWEQGRFTIEDGIVEQNGKRVSDFIAEVESHLPAEN